MPILSERSISNFLYWVTRKKWLILSFLLSLTLFYLPTPENLAAQSQSNRQGRGDVIKDDQAKKV